MSARILAIEDNPTNMDLMVYLLRAFGHTPLLAYDGEAGVQAARRAIPDLVLCDINLPKMDGYGVLRSLKSQPSLRDIPVIAVTALAMVGDRERLLDAGFDGYIAKPIEAESFVSQVEQFLGADLRSQQAPGVSAGVAEAVLVAEGANARILVIDDSPVNLELARSTLEPFGYKLSLADSARQGWELAQHEPFDLILCDLHMPDEDGSKFVRKIRADQRLADIPFLLMSASYGEDDESQVQEFAASRFLRRPIEPQLLVDEIRALLPHPEGREGGRRPER